MLVDVISEKLHYQPEDLLGSATTLSSKFFIYTKTNTKEEIKMETKKYYWLKLKEDFFKDKEIKKLRRIAGGDTYTIIYLKLMLLGMRDECKLYFEGIEDTFAEELALELDEDTDNVKVTLLYLLKMGLLQEVNENELFLTRLPECIGKETSKAEIMRKKRARDKELGASPALPPKTNAERQAAHKAKQYCEQMQQVPLCEDYNNRTRYNGNYYLVFKRDECKCKLCGSTENLCVHHIDGFSEEKPENSNKNKLITLCRTCHARIHRSGMKIPTEILQEINYFTGNESNNITKVLPPVTFCYTEKEKEKEKELDIEKEKRKEALRAIISYLNEKAGTKFKPVSKDTQKHINARLEEGYTAEDFKTVIDKKVEEWQGTEMAQYLRPATLFGTKFEAYLNAPAVKRRNYNGAAPIVQVINGREYECRNGRYYIPNGNGVEVNPYADDDLPF